MKSDFYFRSAARHAASSTTCDLAECASRQPLTHHEKRDTLPLRTRHRSLDHGRDSPSSKGDPAANVRILEGHTGSVLASSFRGWKSPGDRRAGWFDRLWDPKTGELKRTLTEQKDNVYDLDFFPRRKTDGELRLGQNDPPVGHAHVHGEGGAERTHRHRTPVGFSPDGKKLASVSVDQTVRLWDVPTGKLEKNPDRHTARVKSLAVAGRQNARDRSQRPDHPPVGMRTPAT